MSGKPPQSVAPPPHKAQKEGKQVNNEMSWPELYPLPWMSIQIKVSEHNVIICSRNRKKHHSLKSNKLAMKMQILGITSTKQQRRWRFKSISEMLLAIKAPEGLRGEHEIRAYIHGLPATQSQTAEEIREYVRPHLTAFRKSEQERAMAASASVDRAKDVKRRGKIARGAVVEDHLEDAIKHHTKVAKLNRLFVEPNDP